MAKGRGGRPPSRLDKRREAEAVEAREHEGEEEAEAEPDAEAGSDADDGDDEDAPKTKKKKAAPKPKKAKAPPKPKKPSVKRVRTPKEEKHRAVWVVFDNASKRVDTFPYNQKADAEALLARKQEEKKGTFYLNLVKDPIKE